MCTILVTVMRCCQKVQMSLPSPYSPLLCVGDGTTTLESSSSPERDDDDDNDVEEARVSTYQ